MSKMLPPPKLQVPDVPAFEFIILATVDAWMSSEEAFQQDGLFCLNCLTISSSNVWSSGVSKCLPKQRKNKPEIQTQIPKAIAMGNAMDPRNLFCFGTSIFE